MASSAAVDGAVVEPAVELVVVQARGSLRGKA